MCGAAVNEREELVVDCEESAEEDTVLGHRESGQLKEIGEKLQ
jgi:hypothetical protein